MNICIECLYNIFAVGAFAYLAVVFGKWWIALFSLLFLRIQIKKKDKPNDGDDEDD